MPDGLTEVAERLRDLLIDRRAEAVRQVEGRAEALLAAQVLVEDDPGFGGWGDVCRAEDDALSYAGRTFGRMRTLAEAWGVPGSRFEGDAEVGRRLTLAWRFYRRFVYVGCPFPNNWWAWQVGIPRTLGDVLLLAGGAFDPAEREDLALTLGYLVSHIRMDMTGANGMWGAMNFLRYGLVSGDSAFVARASRWAAQECEIRPVNGILADFSYSFHGSAVHMGYGRSHFADVGRYVYTMGDSPWQLPEAALSNLVNWLLEFIRWTVVGRGMDPFILGREVSRGEDALLATAVLDGALLAASAPIPRREEVLAFCRGALAEGLRPSCPAAIRLAEGLAGPVPEPFQGARYWPEVEYFVARRPGMTASVKMSSGRTKSWFSIAGENLKGWHTSDGHLILRTSGEAFLNGVVPTMDWERLTGITRAEGFRMPRETAGQSPFACGAVDRAGRVGCCGVDFQVVREDGAVLRVKKSWFFLEDAIVALGSDLFCDGPAEVETVVRQVALPEDAGALPGGRQEEAVSVVAGHDCAYLFPEPTRVRLYTERRTGAWSEINARTENRPEATAARDFAFAVIPHGVRPADARYAVVYLPGRSSEEAEAWWQGAPVSVPQHDGGAHGVRDWRRGTTMWVRWGTGAEVEE